MDLRALIQAQQKTDPTAKAMYDVKAGDTIAQILRNKGYRADDGQYAAAVKALLDANPDLDPRRMRPGQKVALPNPAKTPADTRAGALFENLKTARVGDPLLGGSSSRGLAELTTRYLDLQGEVESAAIEAQELQQLAESGAASTREARQAQIRAATAKKKFAVVEKLLSGEIESTRAEIVWLEQAMADASGSEQLLRRAQMSRARANLEALQSVRGGAAKEQRPTK